MKRKRKHTLLAFTAGAVLFGALPQVVSAQDQDMAQVVSTADLAAKAGDWATAYPVYIEATERADAKKFGVQMAYVWFRRGQAAQILGIEAGRPGDEAALAQRDELLKAAIEAYKQCSELGPAEENPYKNRVRYYIGQCHLISKEYQKTLDAFAEFRENYNKKNSDEKWIFEGPNKGRFFLETTEAYLKLEAPNLEKGESGLVWLLNPLNKTEYKISDKKLVAIFYAYCEAIKREHIKSTAAENKEAASLLENRLISFMVNNRGLIKLPSFQMYALTPNFLKLSIEMKKLEMHKASFTLQSFLPNTTEAKEEMELKVDQIGAADNAIDLYDIVEKVTVEKHLNQLKEKVEAGTPHEVHQMIIMAQNFTEENNPLASFAIYEMIELYHNDSPFREDMLFQLVYSSSQIGAILKTADYGQRFIDAFPSSKHIPAVEELMLTSLFANKHFDKCITIANKILPNLQEGTKQHDIALYCLGGSHYYLAQSLDASAPLAKHVELYSKEGSGNAQQIMATSYWDGSNDTYLLNYRSAAEKLDKFLAKFPKNLGENPYYPLALYDRANCHSQLEEIENSNKLLDIVCRDFRDHHVVDRAFLLRGNNYQVLEDYQKAYEDYKMALEISKKLQHKGVEEETLYSLIGLLGRKDQKDPAVETQNYKLAVAYYDEFWSKFSKGQFRTFVAVSGLPALKSVGRGQEALGNLKQVIVELAALKDAPGMDKAINSYTDEYLEVQGNTPAMLRDHFNKDFPFDDQAYYARSLVKMSLVAVYNALADEAKGNEASQKKWRIAAKGQLDEVAKFPVDQLNNYTLVSVGNAITKYANSINQYKESLRFYEQALIRIEQGKEDSFKNEAIFGYAIALSKVGGPASIKKAVALLVKLKDDELSSRSTVAKALASLTSLTKKASNYDDTIKFGTEFVDKFRNTSPNLVNVRVDLAEAYEKTGNTEAAMSQLKSIVLTHTSLLKYSGPAVLKIAELAEKQSDIVGAYRALASYRKLVVKSFDSAQESGKMNASNSGVWDTIKQRVNDLSAEPAVKAAIKEDEEKAAAKEKALGHR